MSRKPIAAFSGLGVRVPAQVVTNADLSLTLDTSDQWIQERTGIRERRVARADESLTELTEAASRDALAQAGMTPMDLDGIVVATVTPDRRMPSQACDLQAALGAHKAVGFDIAAACPGFVFASGVAEGLIATGTYRNLLIVGAERLSTITDWQDRGTAVLFGDGAGAAIVTPATDDRGILSTYLRSDGRLADLLHIPAGGGMNLLTAENINDRGQYMKMAGREVFKAAVKAMGEACDEAIRRAGVTAEDIDLFVPHQANLRIIEATAKHSSIPMAKVMVNVDIYGNTSAASIPLALDQAEREGRLKKGTLVLMVAFGAGFTWGAVVARW
jgi:3-oxoacyl-[acyl-carrier-protein] synthase-3